MNARERLIQTILEVTKPAYLTGMTTILKGLPDTSLIAYALELGIDTDAIFAVAVRS